MQESKVMSEYRMALKDKILQAAMKEFRSKGIKAVKMDDIAAQLSISKRTLYELYANKEDLLLEGMKKYCAERREESMRNAQGKMSTMDVLIQELHTKMREFKTTNPLFYSDIEHYSKLLDFLRQEKNANHELFVQFLRRGEEEGYFCQGLDYDLIANLLDEQSNLIMAQKLYRNHPMQEVLFNTLHIAVRGLCTPKGIKVIDAFMAKHLNKYGIKPYAKAMGAKPD